MNKIIALSAALMLFASCKKNDDPVAYSSKGMNIPVFAADSALCDPSALYITPGISDVNGLLVVYSHTRMITDTSGSTSVYTRQWETALFRDDSDYHNTTPVTINGNTLRHDKNTMYTYLIADPGNVWNPSGNNQWNCAGNGAIPAFSAATASLIPSFTGTLPATVPMHSSISYTFNSSNTSNADTAYLVLFTPYAMVISNTVSAKGGTAVISTSSSFISNWQNELFNVWGIPCKGAMLMAVVYNHEEHTIAPGKKVACVQVKQMVRSVTLL